MKVHFEVRPAILRVVSALVASSVLITLPAFAQEKPVQSLSYKFIKSDVLKYEVKSSLDISLKGSDPAFMPGGIDTPLAWDVSGVFENVVLEVNSADGTGTLERRVRSIQSSGNWNEEKFKMAWDREKDKGKKREDFPPSLMNDFIWSTIENPVKYTVDAEGKYTPADPNCDRLVMRRGMMVWPFKAGETAWTTQEKIAVPVLHDKITLEFKNTLVKETTRDGRRLRVIRATASVKEANEEKGQRPMEGKIEFTASGDSVIEFDTTNGRIHTVNIDLTIRLSGKGPVPSGGDGDIKGTVTYKENQVFKD
jgi:hypothetical protein